MDDQTGEEINGGMDSSLPCETIIEHTLDDFELKFRAQEKRSREFMLAIARLHPENITPAEVKDLITIGEELHLFTRGVTAVFRAEAENLKTFVALAKMEIAKHTAHYQKKTIWNSTIIVNPATGLVVLSALMAGFYLGYLFGTLSK